MEYLPTNLLVKSIGSISKSFIGQSFDVVYQGQRKVLKTGGAHWAKFGFNPSLIDGILNVLSYELAS